MCAGCALSAEPTVHGFKPQACQRHQCAPAVLQGRYIISQEYSFSNQAVFDTLQKRFPHLHFGDGHDNSAPHRVFDTEKVVTDAGQACIGYWHACIS